MYYEISFYLLVNTRKVHSLYSSVLKFGKFLLTYVPFNIIIEFYIVFAVLDILD